MLPSAAAAAAASYHLPFAHIFASAAAACRTYAAFAAGSETGLSERFVFMKQSRKQRVKKRVPEQSRLLLQMR